MPGIRVIMVDTGYLFPETWQHMEALRQRLNLNVWVYRTQNDPIAWLHETGKRTPSGGRTWMRAARPTRTSRWSGR